VRGTAVLTRYATSYLGALLLAVLLAPGAAAIALAVRLVDGAPVFYRSNRVGKGGRVFHMYKFRTMRVAKGGRQGHLITSSHDPRVTRLGRWLRRFRLDEIPQLLNVLRGEMVLVGPRPESPEYAEKYTSQRQEMLRLCPGITDPGTLAFLFLETEVVSLAADPSEAYVRAVMPARNRLSLAYARVADPATDALVLVLTVLALLSKRHAQSIGHACFRRFSSNIGP
jgi:lipopolysaccharide/colanic/teichoic acid biosynthesis glycosyltransferase